MWAVTVCTFVLCAQDAPTDGLAPVAEGRVGARPDSAAAYALSLRPDTLPCDTLCALLTRKDVRKKRMNIFKRFFKNFNNYDTTYISPNYYNYTAMLQNTLTFQTFRLRGESEDGSKQTIYTKPESRVKLGPYFGWRWIFLGYTFDVFHPSSAGKTSQFNFSLYSSLLGCDFVYLHNSGNFRLRKAEGFSGVEPKSVKGMAFNGLDASVISFSAYYVFNHKHFSYPAAYNQSTVQRKSCGSFLLGGGYSRQHIRFDHTQLPDVLLQKREDGTDLLIDELKFNDVNYKFYYVSGGYGYNWVVARNWLVAGSFMSSLGVRKMKGEKVRGKEVFLDFVNLSFDCTSRVGLVWNNAHWFAGLSYINHLYLYYKNRLALTNSINYCNLYVGFFFNRKKQYR